MIKSWLYLYKNTVEFKIDQNYLLFVLLSTTSNVVTEFYNDTHIQL